jgi:alkaline phosphatase
LIEDDPGKRLNVILGGGFRNFFPKDFVDPRSNMTGSRSDSRNLVETWKDMKKRSGANYFFVNSTTGLKAALSNKKLEFLFGLFNHTHMAFESERNLSAYDEPSLTEMTRAAIQVLSRNDNGFVLLVEGGRIDHAHHKNLALMALDETVSLDKAVETAMSMEELKAVKNETLIVVTADHAHTLTFNGYPARGQSIFGIADNDTDSLNFTSLMYGNGPGHDHRNPNVEDPANLRNVYYSAVKLPESNHGGEDVGLYSRGPFAHLFHGLQDQSFVAHVIGYAACIGNYNQSDHCYSSPAIMTKPHLLVLLPSFILLLIKRLLNL